MPGPRSIAQRLARAAVVAAVAVAAATVAVALLEDRAAVLNASSVYLVAVVLAAIAAGVPAAALASVGSVLTYNFLFTEPRYTLNVSDPGEWLNLVLLLFVGVTVGQLAGLQRTRTELALAREREARALFRVSRALVTRETADVVLPAIAASVREETGLDRVWFALGPDDARERVVADTGNGRPPAGGGSHAVLRRMPGDLPAQWVHVHDAAARPGAGRGEARFRIRIEASGATLGSIWAVRRREAGDPDRTATRLLAATADQVGQALAHDRLVAASREAEVARRSDALKTALIESVSHAFRTPLASIRAAAGTLMDPSVALSAREARASAASIDREAERLNRLVSNLLDLGRIEGGVLQASAEVLELDDFASRAVGRVAHLAGDRAIQLDLAAAPAVRADPVLLDEALANIVDNAVRHTPAGTTICLSAAELPDEPFVRLTVEDSGPGVADESLDRLFEKFYRAADRGRGSGGTGIGLAVVRGLAGAMDGRVTARRSELGGLAIDLDLPVARVPSGVVG
ncbi:MAG TPA: ATP-binding protein [Candidatus Limnocylindrales bacterium]|jgi:two-component system sensor histidine kinase KdpD|nr:ATP-binding protein [Candidatus Limnocylindrales bacterium]